MSATVLSFFRPAPVTTGDWSQQELAEFYRVEAASVQAGLRLSIDRGLSDEGDPWLVFCREDGEVFLHFARIDGAYVICSDMINRPLTGPDFRTLLSELVSQNPSVLPLPRDAANGRRGAKILMHPAALLAAIVATACLFSSMNEAVASELDMGPHSGSHPGDALAADAVAPAEAVHKASPHTSPGSEPRAHDNFDRELALITGVILACIATYANDQHSEASVAVSPLSIAADGGLKSGHSVTEAAAAFEPAGGRQAGTASHSPAAKEGFKPLGEAEASSAAQATLQDLPSANVLPSAPSPQVVLPTFSEPVPKIAFAGDPAVLVLNSYHLVAVAGPGNGTPRPTDVLSQREHAAAPSDQGSASGTGPDRGGDASQAAVSMPAASDSGMGRSAAVASAGETGSSRSTAAISTDSGATRNVASAVATDASKVVAAAATTVSGDGTKSAAVPIPDATSTSAATLTKTLAAMSTLLTFGTSDLSFKGIGAIFNDVSVLSSKTVSLLLHALVDIQTDAGSSKTSSDVLSGLASTSGKLTGTTAVVGSSTAATESVFVNPSVVDASHTVAKVTDTHASTGTGAVTTALSSTDATKTILPPSTDATKVAVSAGTVTEASKTALVTTSAGDHASDAATHTSSTSPSASVADSATKAVASGGSTGTGDLTNSTKVDSTSTVATKVVDGMVSASGTTSISTISAEATAKTASAAGGITAAADHPDPTAVHQPDTAASLDALHAVAALTSSSNTISRAVSVGLGASATVLDSVQLRIIDLFLQATPDAKFRAVDNTLEIYDPSASSDVSSHAAVWDIGGGAFVRVIGITDTHIVS